jgi:streptogramin lyase
MIRFISFLLTIILPSSALHAQAWTSYTNTDNVRQLSIESGRLWGATSGGVVAYTPSTGGFLKLTNTDGLGGIDFNSVDVDTAGNIWLGAGDGWLSKYSPSSGITNYPVREIQEFLDRAIVIYDLLAEGDRIWMGNDLGVSKFLIYSNGGEIKDTARKLGDIPDEEDVSCVALVGNYLWAGTARGIAFIDKDNENIQYFGFWRSFLEGDNGLSSADIRSIGAYHDTVLAGTDDGIFKFVVSPDTAWEPFGLAGLTISSIISTDSELLAATNAGAFRYDGSSWVSLSTSGLPQSGLNDLAIDSSGNLWAGTPSSGFAGLVDTTWTIHSIPGPASNFIRNMAIESNGTVWMTHDSKGISEFDGSEWVIYNSSNSDPDGSGPLGGLEDNSLHSIEVAPGDEIWAGSWGRGLYKYERSTNSWLHWENSNSPMIGVPEANDYWAATAVVADADSNVWVSSMGADSGLVVGVFDFSDSLWHTYHTGPNTVLENDVTSLLIQNNSLWLGMTQGLHRLDFGGTPFDEFDDLWTSNISLEFIVDIGSDPFGNTWFGALTGLYYVPSGRDDARQVGLPPEIAGRVNAVASDGIGNIWVGTVAGLGVYRPNAGVWKYVFNTSNSPLLNDQVTEVVIDIQTGLVYIGTAGGLSILESGVEPPSKDLSDVEAYPNPIIVDDGDELLFFKRVPPEAEISIYTIAGDLVDEFNMVNQDYWDLKNSKGEPVAGGVYVFLVRSKTASGTGKFAVIK